MILECGAFRLRKGLDMKITSMRRAWITGFAFLALVLLAAPIGVRAASPPDVLEACVNPGNGNMRLVAASAACHNNETRVQWNVTGPAGPTGPTGPAGATGPAGPPGTSSGGPPFVWICTPAHLPNAGGNPRHDVYVFNGSAVTANVAVNLLDKDGGNLTGVTIPGSAQTYPGEAGATTVPLLAARTRDVQWVMPNTGADDTNVVFSVRVTSDQPIVVGANFQFTGHIPSQCSLLPK